MPVVGVVDPSHKANKASATPPPWLPVEELLSKAYTAEPKWSPYTFEIINAALGEIEERGDNISTTTLTGPCPRSTVLERKEDYVITMDDIWRAFRGTMVHYVLEGGARPNSIAEVRFFAPFAGDDLISCKPDLITDDGSIWDYKNTAKNPNYDYPYKGNAEQVQLNRYIVSRATDWEKDGKPTALPFDVRSMRFNHLVLVYMDLDGPKTLEVVKSVQVRNKTNEGTHPVKMPDIWTDAQVEETFTPRYQAMRAALESYPVWPEGVESVWGGPKGWECPGYPYCPLKGKCLASRYPNGLVW
jgi:hypothetical protein